MIDETTSDFILDCAMSKLNGTMNIKTYEFLLHLRELDKAKNLSEWADSLRLQEKHNYLRSLPQE